MIFFYWQTVRGSGFFELEVVELQNPAGRLANGDVCSDEKCSTYFRLCLKEYQSNVTVSSPCTYGNTSSPVLAGNSFTFVEPDKSNARLVLPFQFRWTVSDTPQLILARPTTCNHFPTACHTCRPPYRTRYLLFEHVFSGEDVFRKREEEVVCLHFQQTRYNRKIFRSKEMR